MSPFNFIIIILSWFLTFNDSVFAQETINEVILVEQGDKEMDAAVQKAKATLPQFLSRAIDNPKKNEQYYVYVHFSEATTVEYLWISNIKKTDRDTYSGQVNSKPGLLQSIKKGDQVNFKKKSINDWEIYNSETDKSEGAYTSKVLERRK
jgi:uncharacterized protein YegJ (DUF2314 family)